MSIVSPHLFCRTPHFQDQEGDITWREAPF
jgi:hypothetical protein